MKFKFLIAEDVRPELNGKLTIVGLLADDVLIAHVDRPKDVAEDAIAALDKLTFLVNISDIQPGAHELSGQLFFPSGEPIADALPLGSFDIPKERSHNVVVVARPLPVKEEGIYSFRLTIDGEDFTFPFEVRFERT